jgi:hypothetical protein
VPSRDSKRTAETTRSTGIPLLPPD